MPKLARQENIYRYDTYSTDYSENYYIKRHNVREQYVQSSNIRLKRVVNKKKVNRNNLIHKIVSTLFLLVLAFTVIPYGFNRVTKLLFNPTPLKTVRVDYRNLVFPTANYLSNHWFLGVRSLEGAKTKKAEMAQIVEDKELSALENSLKILASNYPSLYPSVYVWDYDTGNYADINADEIFPTASIIKLPVLAHLFRALEKNQISLEEKMPLTEYYRSEGSGSLQFKAANSEYTIDTLARMMITESDNSATNMLISRLGAMTDLNSVIRHWGLKHTFVQNWLPDLAGTNQSTTRDIARILYNLDNPEFLNNNSRAKIFDYMGHVHNNRLIAAGLPNGVEFMHKTGDIGTMLGDAGIVYAPNGKKYIVVIFVKRPHNSPLGKEFIVKASETIYNNMVY